MEILQKEEVKKSMQVKFYLFFFLFSIRDFPYAGLLGERVALYNARHKKLQHERAARWPQGLPVEKVSNRCKANDVVEAKAAKLAKSAADS